MITSAKGREQNKMKIQSNMTTSENIANLLIDAKNTSEVHVIEQTIAHRQDEMNWDQVTLLKQACKEKRQEFSQ